MGVDTQVYHGFVRCGAVGAITGVGNALPQPVLRLIALCERAARGDVVARRLAAELDDALRVLSTFDEGPDLVLYYKHLMVLEGHPAYEHQLHATDVLGASRRGFLEAQWRQFKTWWNEWPGARWGPRTAAPTGASRAATAVQDEAERASAANRDA